MFNIFIGFDKSQEVAFHVLAHTLRKNSSIPISITSLDIRQLNFNRTWDPLQSTEFTYTRFLVPHLCNFQGKALFMDSDMLCLGDVAELANLSMDGLALRVVKHNHVPTTTAKMVGQAQTVYPRKNWSSLMLMNCSELKVWSKEAVENRPASWLHRFEPISDEKIGELPSGWNDLDVIYPNTKLVHYTEGGPWLKNYTKHKYGEAWYQAREHFIFDSLKTSEPQP